MRTSPLGRVPSLPFPAAEAPAARPGQDRASKPRPTCERRPPVEPPSDPPGCLADGPAADVPFFQEDAQVRAQGGVLDGLREKPLQLGGLELAVSPQKPHDFQFPRRETRHIPRSRAIDLQTFLHVMGGHKTQLQIFLHVVRRACNQRRGGGRDQNSSLLIRFPSARLPSER